jgi:hypothetical protein
LKLKSNVHERVGISGRALQRSLARTNPSPPPTTLSGSVMTVPTFVTRQGEGRTEGGLPTGCACGAGAPPRANGSQTSQWHGEDAPCSRVADGKVVRAVDGRPEIAAPPFGSPIVRTPDEFAGN